MIEVPISLTALVLPMEISIHSLLEGATRATGTVAIIDVFRAFTTAAVALANGASRIVMVRSVEEALALRDAGIGQICMGEVRGRAPDGFDFGNSPFEVSDVDFSGKTIIQRTSAGTQGIVAATGPSDFMRPRWSRQRRPFRALLSDLPDQISLVAMGDNGIKRTDEDELCAIHLRNRLEGRPGDAGRRSSPDPAQAAKSGAFTIRPARICTPRTSTSRSISIATISRVRVKFENGRPVARIETPVVTMPNSPT